MALQEAWDVQMRAEAFFFGVAAENSYHRTPWCYDGHDDADGGGGSDGTTNPHQTTAVTAAVIDMAVRHAVASHASSDVDGDHNGPLPSLAWGHPSPRRSFAHVWRSAKAARAFHRGWQRWSIALRDVGGGSQAARAIPPGCVMSVPRAFLVAVQGAVVSVVLAVPLHAPGRLGDDGDHQQIIGHGGSASSWPEDENDEDLGFQLRKDPALQALVDVACRLTFAASARRLLADPSAVCAGADGRWHILSALSAYGGSIVRPSLSPSAASAPGAAEFAAAAARLDHVIEASPFPRWESHRVLHAAPATSLPETVAATVDRAAALLGRADDSVHGPLCQQLWSRALHATGLKLGPHSRTVLRYLVVPARADGELSRQPQWALRQDSVRRLLTCGLYELLSRALKGLWRHLAVERSARNHSVAEDSSVPPVVDSRGEIEREEGRSISDTLRGIVNSTSCNAWTAAGGRIGAQLPVDSIVQLLSTEEETATEEVGDGDNASVIGVGLARLKELMTTDAAPPLIIATRWQELVASLSCVAARKFNEPRPIHGAHHCDATQLRGLLRELLTASDGRPMVEPESMPIDCSLLVGAAARQLGLERREPSPPSALPEKDSRHSTCAGDVYGWKAVATIIVSSDPPMPAVLANALSWGVKASAPLPRESPRRNPQVSLKEGTTGVQDGARDDFAQSHEHQAEEEGERSLSPSPRGGKRQRRPPGVTGAQRNNFATEVGDLASRVFSGLSPPTVGMEGQSGGGRLRSTLTSWVPPSAVATAAVLRFLTQLFAPLLSCGVGLRGPPCSLSVPSYGDLVRLSDLERPLTRLADMLATWSDMDPKPLTTSTTRGSSNNHTLDTAYSGALCDMIAQVVTRGLLEWSCHHNDRTAEAAAAPIPSEVEAAARRLAQPFCDILTRAAHRFFSVMTTTKATKAAAAGPAAPTIPIASICSVLESLALAQRFQATWFGATAEVKRDNDTNAQQANNDSATLNPAANNDFSRFRGWLVGTALPAMVAALATTSRAGKATPAAGASAQKSLRSIRCAVSERRLMEGLIGGRVLPPAAAAVEPLRTAEASFPWLLNEPVLRAVLRALRYEEEAEEEEAEEEEEAGEGPRHAWREASQRTTLADVTALVVLWGISRGRCGCHLANIVLPQISQTSRAARTTCPSLLVAALRESKDSARGGEPTSVASLWDPSASVDGAAAVPLGYTARVLLVQTNIACGRLGDLLASRFETACDEETPIAASRPSASAAPPDAAVTAHFEERWINELSLVACELWRRLLKTLRSSPPSRQRSPGCDEAIALSFDVLLRSFKVTGRCAARGASGLLESTTAQRLSAAMMEATAFVRAAKQLQRWWRRGGHPTLKTIASHEQCQRRAFEIGSLWVLADLQLMAVRRSATLSIRDVPSVYAIRSRSPSPPTPPTVLGRPTERESTATEELPVPTTPPSRTDITCRSGHHDSRPAAATSPSPNEARATGTTTIPSTSAHDPPAVIAATTTTSATRVLAIAPRASTEDFRGGGHEGSRGTDRLMRIVDGILAAAAQIHRHQPTVSASSPTAAGDRRAGQSPLPRRKGNGMLRAAPLVTKRPPLAPTTVGCQQDRSPTGPSAAPQLKVTSSRPRKEPSPTAPAACGPPRRLRPLPLAPRLPDDGPREEEGGSQERIVDINLFDEHDVEPHQKRDERDDCRRRDSRVVLAKPFGGPLNQPRAEGALRCIDMADGGRAPPPIADVTAARIGVRPSVPFHGGTRGGHPHVASFSNASSSLMLRIALRCPAATSGIGRRSVVDPILSGVLGAPVPPRHT